MHKKMVLKSINEWKKRNPKESEEIQKILELCRELGIDRLQPIAYPQVQFKTSGVTSEIQ